MFSIKPFLESPQVNNERFTTLYLASDSFHSAILLALLVLFLLLMMTPFMVAWVREPGEAQILSLFSLDSFFGESQNLKVSSKSKFYNLP